MRPATAAKSIASSARVSARADSLRDVDDRLEQIGLTPKTGWYTSIALYALGGIPSMLLHLIDPQSYNTGLFVLGGLGVTMSLLSVLGLRYFPQSHRATHARLTIGFGILVTGGLVVGDARQAFLLLPLMVSLPPAIYYGLRAAVPYLIGTALFASYFAIGIGQSWAPALAVCSTVTVVTLGVSMMIAQARTRAFARVHRTLAFTDALTGLANTRALNVAIDKQLQDPESLRAALFAIDLDDFKQVNDRFDHARGDEVLKAVADGLVACGGVGDLFARRGGDEFSLLVSDPAGRDLGELSQCLVDAIADARKRVCPEVSPSGSVAYVYARADDTVGSLLRRADDALHEAKTEYHSQDGPNRPVRLAIIDRRRESDRAESEKLSASDHPGRRVGDATNEMGSGRMRGSEKLDRPLWRFAAAMNASIGLAIGTVALLGYTQPLGVAAGLAVMGGFLLVAAACMLAGWYPLQASGIHVTLVLSLALLSYAVWAADAAGAALIDLYAVIAVFAFHFFRSSVAARYLPVSFAVFAGFAIGVSYPYAGAHVIVFTTMVLAAAVLTAKVRQVTTRFIVENWRLSQIDGLTGLSNVRALRARVEEVVSAARAGGPTPTLLAIDLDEFKMVNDSFSHSVGDQVLVQVARTIADNVRTADMVARRGGDEFLVVTEVEDLDELEKIAERVREAVARVRRRICPQLLPTACVAVVHWNDSDDSDTFMHRADIGLHEKKLALRRSRSADAS
jgi:diguanylate cyclase (GGDEF)-like protein